MREGLDLSSHILIYEEIVSNEYVEGQSDIIVHNSEFMGDEQIDNHDNQHFFQKQNVLTQHYDIFLQIDALNFS